MSNVMLLSDQEIVRLMLEYRGGEQVSKEDIERLREVYLHYCMKQFDRIVEHGTPRQIFETVLWKSHLNNNGLYAENSKPESGLPPKDTPNGQVIGVNFGTDNCGQEICFSHKAISIKWFTNNVLAVPIISYKKGMRLTHHMLKVQLPGHRRPSVVLVNQPGYHDRCKVYFEDTINVDELRIDPEEAARLSRLIYRKTRKSNYITENQTVLDAIKNLMKYSLELDKQTETKKHNIKEVEMIV